MRTWQYAGNIREARVAEEGVYCLALSNSGAPDRITYFGTANGGSFSRRWKEHLDSFQIGERTVWNVADGEDVYALMQWQDKTIAQRAYFERSCQAGKMFIGKRDRKSFEQWIARHQFDTERYLAKLDVYCSAERDRKVAQRLESQLQFLFRSAHGISYYRGEPNYSWLGKQEQGWAEICKQDYGTFELAPRMIQRLAPEDRVLLEAPAKAMPRFAGLSPTRPRSSLIR